MRAIAKSPLKRREGFRVRHPTPSAALCMARAFPFKVTAVRVWAIWAPIVARHLCPPLERAAPPSGAGDWQLDL